MQYTFVFVLLGLVNMYVRQRHMYGIETYCAILETTIRTQ